MEAAGTAIWAGMGGLLCAAIGPFCCYVTYFPGLGLGVWAAWTAWQALQVLERDGDDRATRSTLNAGLVAGIASALLSGFFLMIFVVAMLFYVVLFAVAGLGALSQ